jgi:hypothetical protein
MAESSLLKQVRVEFHGGRGESGPLTVGQENVLAWVGADANKWSAVIPLFHPLDAEISVERVAAAIGVLIGRHESLRTNYPRRAGEAVQVVRETGELAADVHESTGAMAEFLQRLEQRMCAAPFDLADELPVRAAIVTRDGAPVMVVLIITHMAVDVASVTVLSGELTDLLAGKAPEDLPAPGRQPLDQARLERAPIGRRRSESAVRYWRSRLSQGPLRLPVPAIADEAAPHLVRLTSPAAALALTRIVARTGAGHSSVVLAAVGALLGRHTGDPSTLLASVSGNRFHPALRGYVGSLAQDALIALDLTVPTFDALAAHAWSAQLTAYRHSQFDSKPLWVTMEAIFEQRGTRFERDWVFNDVGAHREPDRRNTTPVPLDLVDAARPRTRIAREAAGTVPVLLFFRLLRACDELELEVHVDGRFFDADTVEGLLRGVERLLVDAAAGDVALAETHVARTGDWWRIDGCQVQRAAVDELLGAGRAFLDDGVLVGYLATPGLTPRAAHLACMAGLASRPTAMAPGRYVICATAPQDLTDLDAWRRQPVLAEGDGRTSE